jgi:4a-hydroxytetrahydrobiopterin dehydratase
LRDIRSWALRDGKLHREYKFGDFAEAFGFMSTCALVAQKSPSPPAVDAM